MISHRFHLIAFALLLGGCGNQDKAPAPVRAIVKATPQVPVAAIPPEAAVQSGSPTVSGEAAAEAVKPSTSSLEIAGQTTSGDRPAPVSETTAAKLMSAMGFAPQHESSPELRMADPKELEFSDTAPLTFFGFNLKDTSISATREPGGAVANLAVQSGNNEHLVISAEEWHKLGTGVFSIKVTDKQGRVSELPFRINIE
jgi:hypothetical protein